MERKTSAFASRATRARSARGRFSSTPRVRITFALWASNAATRCAMSSVRSFSSRPFGATALFADEPPARALPP
jgi:hypothetical protein